MWRRGVPLECEDVVPRLVAPSPCSTYIFAVKHKPAVRIFYPGNSGLKFSMKDTQLTKGPCNLPGELHPDPLPFPEECHRTLLYLFRLIFNFLIQMAGFGIQIFSLAELKIGRASCRERE